MTKIHQGLTSIMVVNVPNFKIRKWDQLDKFFTISAFRMVSPSLVISDNETPSPSREENLVFNCGREYISRKKRELLIS